MQNIGKDNANRLNQVETIDLINQIINTLTKGSTINHAVVASSGSAVSLVSSNSDRKEVIIHNNSDEVLYIKYGSAPTLSPDDYTIPIFPNATHYENTYDGEIFGVWTSASGDAQVTEIEL